MLPQLAEKIRDCELRFGIVSFLGSKSILRVELKKSNELRSFDEQGIKSNRGAFGEPTRRVGDEGRRQAEDRRLSSTDLRRLQACCR